MLSHKEYIEVVKIIRNGRLDFSKQQVALGVASHALASILSQQGMERRLTAILVADVVGYSRLTRYAALLARVNELFPDTQ